MAFKTVVTVFRSETADTDHLRAATDLARREDGHLHVLALGTERVLPGAYYAGANAVALQGLMEQAMAEAAEAEAAATRILKAETDVSWDVIAAVAQFGGLAEILARRAAIADLTVLPKPYGESRGNEDVALTETALFATRTPVLILPEGMQTCPAARRIMIGWNRSSEALAAIRAALPLLIRAESVEILIVDPPEHDPDRSDPGGALAEMLARHGARANISVAARTMPRISDVMLRHAVDRNVDLVVMGAYGHSRFREAILGGATRNMLENAKVAVLMAH